MDGKSTSQPKTYDIRLAVTDDLPDLVKLGEAFIKEIDTPELYNPLQWSKLLEMSINPEQGLALVLVKEGKVIGDVIGIYSAHPFNNEVVTLLELMWYVHKEDRGSLSSIKMFKMFEKAGWDKGVSQIHISSRADLKHEAIGKMYTKLGYTPQDLTYVKKRN